MDLTKSVTDCPQPPRPSAVPLSVPPYRMAKWTAAGSLGLSVYSWCWTLPGYKVHLMFDAGGSCSFRYTRRSANFYRIERMSTDKSGRTRGNEFWERGIIVTWVGKSIDRVCLRVTKSIVFWHGRVNNLLELLVTLKETEKRWLSQSRGDNCGSYSLS